MRKPMDFTIDGPSGLSAGPEQAIAVALPASKSGVSVNGTVPRKPKQQPTLASEIQKKTVGARVTASIYRQLKSHAALSGTTVQDLVEQAIREKLERISKSA